ncbi:unnamed protein product [Moneuplotes crassus]|uniref:Deacetylase sirtuin-type domain-containing protein n=1 Tax=Euplotes crassus TaxID=5936 RepID=A0AAD1XRJ9_EUPCR|nr:unnamed protein product [Moneuplotes crassus]
MADPSSLLYQRVAKSIMRNKAMLVTAGAGIGIDSGLPDFRGKEGLWKAYPYFKNTNMSFTDAANPRFFSMKPKEFWFFYGHRYNSYQDHLPHSGFHALLKVCREYLGDKYHVYTSNVDGHFQKAGFNKRQVTECHGSINHFQCDKCRTIYLVPHRKRFELDIKNFVCNDIPKCKDCASPVRPNILMFGDREWISSRKAKQEGRLRDFLSTNNKDGITIIEIGAGTAVPTIRMASESVFCEPHSQRTLIRINPDPGNHSMYGINYDVINESNINKCEEEITENELFEIKESSKLALKKIREAVKDFS